MGIVSLVLRTSCLLFFLAVCADRVAGQGEFLTGSETKAGASVAGYFGKENSRGGGFEFGYSIKGISDYAAGVGSQSFNGRNYGFFGLGVTLWPAKQHRNSKHISWGLFGQLTLGDKYRTTTFGTLLSTQAPAGPKTIFVPMIGLGVMTVGTESWGATSRNSSTVGLIDLSLVHQSGPKTKLAISANAMLAEEGNSSLGLSLTVLFEIGKKETSAPPSASPAP